MESVGRFLPGSSGQRDLFQNGGRPLLLSPWPPEIPAQRGRSSALPACPPSRHSRLHRADGSRAHLSACLQLLFLSLHSCPGRPFESLRFVTQALMAFLLTLCWSSTLSRLCPSFLSLFLHLYRLTQLGLFPFCGVASSTDASAKSMPASWQTFLVDTNCKASTEQVVVGDTL